MTLRIAGDEEKNVPDEVSLKTMNRKLENFVEIVLKKLVEQSTTIKDLKKRVKKLEQENQT